MQGRNILGLIAVVVAGLIETATANQQADPLERKVGIGYSYRSFQEAVQQIETKTGFKVQCANELADYMQLLFMGRGVGDPKHPEPEPQQTVRAFLDQICRPLSMTWRFDPSTSTLVLDHPWKTTDPRSSAELLKAVQSTGFGQGRDKEWGAVFKVLISKPENISNAWKVLQTAAIEDSIFVPREFKPILIKPIISTGLHKYVFILIEQPIFMYPGHGSASYFCFKDDGTLAIAGIMNTGHRCALVDATVDNEYGARSEAASEIHMILKVNLREFLIARFHLEDDGLKLFSLVDGYGEPVENDGQSIGVSLLK